MDAVKFVMESKRMCNYYGSDCMSKPCPIVKELKGCKLQSSDKKEAEKIVKLVETWSKNNPLIVLTEDQETAIRGRIAEGWKWAFKNKKGTHVVFTENEPQLDKNAPDAFVFDGDYSPSERNVYDFITWEDSPIYLPDLLRNKEI